MILKPRPFRKPNLGHPLARGLVGCWFMNEGSGNIVQDLSGNGNTGTAVTAPTWVPGKFGAAIKRTISQGAFDCGNSASLQNANELTAIVWAFNDGAANNGILFAKPGYYSATSGFNIDYYYSQDRLRFSVKQQYFNDTAGIWPLNTWAFFAISYKKNSWAKCYMDGVVIGNLSANTDDIPLTENLNIGGTGFLMGFRLISHAMFYTRALSAQEIAQLYREPFVLIEREPIELWSAATQGAGGAAVAIAGSVAATSTITGSVKVARKLLGSVAASGAVSGTAKVARKISGAVEATSDVSGAISVSGGSTSFCAALSAEPRFAGEVGAEPRFVGSVAVKGCS